MSKGNKNNDVTTDSKDALEKNSQDQELLDQDSSDQETDEKKEDLSQEIDKLKNDLKSKTNVLLRTMAEYDNYRKRTEKEKTSIYANATADTVSAILPIADSIERALSSLDENDKDYKKGLELIQNQLLESFKNLGVESFGKKGDKFDPDIHNAISHVENGDSDNNIVSEVFQKGYRISDKIIRYAMVQTTN